MTIKHIG